MFVGVGAARVRDMFDQAKKHAPCIGSSTNRRGGPAQEPGWAAVTRARADAHQLLVEMDGFEGRLA